MKHIVIIAILLFSLSQISPQAFGSGTGSILLQIQGYGTLHGQLQNAIIQANNSIAMAMTVNDQIQTSQGSFPVQATGTWHGVRADSTLAGTIQDIAGKIHICIILACSDAEFVGQGNWTGLLDASSNGNGNFTATITFTKSLYPQIPQGQSIPTYGSWMASFISPVPELQWSVIFSLTVLLATMQLAFLNRRSVKRKKR